MGKGAPLVATFGLLHGIWKLLFPCSWGIWVEYLQEWLIEHMNTNIRIDMSCWGGRGKLTDPGLKNKVFKNERHFRTYITVHNHEFIYYLWPNMDPDWMDPDWIDPDWHQSFWWRKDHRLAHSAKKKKGLAKTNKNITRLPWHVASSDTIRLLNQVPRSFTVTCKSVCLACWKHFTSLLFLPPFLELQHQHQAVQIKSFFHIFSTFLEHQH